MRLVAIRSSKTSHGLPPQQVYVRRLASAIVLFIATDQLDHLPPVKTKIIKEIVEDQCVHIFGYCLHKQLNWFLNLHAPRAFTDQHKPFANSPHCDAAGMLVQIVISGNWVPEVAHLVACANKASRMLALP